MLANKSNSIFVVDDEPIISATLAAILSHAGYRALGFDAAQRALDEAMASPPDLLISNTVLPGLSGIELAMIFQRLFPLCKIILFSSLARTADSLQRVARAGYTFKVLTRPLHPKDLLEVLSVL